MKTPGVLIDVGTQRDGYTFRPDPRSRVWLEKTYPNLPRVASVFIGFDQHQDFFHSLGYKKYDPRLCLGGITIAKLVTDQSKSSVISAINKHQQFKSISII